MKNEITKSLRAKLWMSIYVKNHTSWQIFTQFVKKLLKKSTRSLPLRLLVDAHINLPSRPEPRLLPNPIAVGWKRLLFIFSRNRALCASSRAPPALGINAAVINTRFQLIPARQILIRE